MQRRAMSEYLRPGVGTISQSANEARVAKRLFGLAFGHVVGPDLRVGFPIEQFFGFKEKTKLARGGFRGVGAVNEVEGVAQTEVAADGAGLGLAGLCGAHHLAGDGDGVLAGDGEDDYGGAGHELNQAGIKRLAFVRFVVRLGEAWGNARQLHANDLEAALFETGDDLPNKVSLNGIGLQDEESSFHEGNVIGAGLRVKEKRIVHEGSRRCTKKRKKEKTNSGLDFFVTLRDPWWTIIFV